MTQTPPPRTYRTNFGPPNFALLAKNSPATIDVYVVSGLQKLMGTAHRVGQIGTGRRLQATWRLVVDGVEIPGIFVCVARIFVEVDTWVQRIAERRRQSQAAT